MHERSYRALCDMRIDDYNYHARYRILRSPLPMASTTIRPSSRSPTCNVLVVSVSFWLLT